MPKALRDRQCARSFSTVASTASMLGRAVWATGWGRVPGRTPTQPTRLWSGAKSLPCPATCSPGLTILESRQPLLAPARFAQRWQCVLPSRTVAKGWWLRRLGGAPPVTLTVPVLPRSRHSPGDRVAGPRGIGQCSCWHHCPHSVFTPSLAVPGSGIESDPDGEWGWSPFLATRRRGGPQPYSDHSVPDGERQGHAGRLKTQFLCDLEQLPSPLWASLVPCPFPQGSSQSC